MNTREGSVPSVMSVIYLARHGRTALNAAGALRGHIDVPLDEVGKLEAEALGEALAAQAITRVVSSPLRRALETAGAVARRHALGTAVDDRLADRFYGEWAGVSAGEVVARWGSLDAAPGVEPPANVRRRALAALAAIAQEADGTVAAVVSHDAVIRIALAALDAGLGSPDQIPQGTACFNVLEYSEGSEGNPNWRVRSVNENPAARTATPAPQAVSPKGSTMAPEGRVQG
jgi:glucosyl-3-phosphoglycerate phosphatase